VIIKSYEIEKINLNKDGIVLFYGKNNGLKNEAIEILNKNKNNILSYQEKEILDNQNNFIETILSKSLFDRQKFIVIKRATDKILEMIVNLQQQNLEDTRIILNSETLEKKSKLRTFFEKNKTFVCVPFYPDNDQTLSKLAYNFLRKKKNFNFILKYKLDNKQM
jgi:DNA polymerase-3 subunit delta